MNKLVTYDPFADAGFDDLFRGFFRPVRLATPSPVSVKMDVTENDKGYVVHAEIPGARKEDIQVTIEGNQVTIGAEVKREVEAKDGAAAAAQRALLRERLPQLHAARRAGRSHERGEIRERRAGADAVQEGSAGRAQAHDPVTRTRAVGLRASRRRRARGRSAHALRRIVLVDVVAEEAPRRRRRCHPPKRVGGDARVFERSRGELDDQHPAADRRSRRRAGCRR